MSQEITRMYANAASAASAADALREEMAKHIAKHKLPRFVWFVDDPLPRNASGKFLRRELRDTFATQMA